ncbi:Sensor protein KdpD [Faecalibacterium prausnitzii]|jgi:two-component system sensor histidine kinase KdpD|nr:Sensor protein KdpD [Faecalibacterium prausnitzii]
MKQTIRKTDILVLLGVFALAFLVMFGIQRISGRIDGVASMVFVLAVFLISIYTDGYFWGVMASLLSVLAVNFAFRSPYFAFNFTLPENLFSGLVMLVVSIMTSTLTTRIKLQEQLRMESETEKMRANLLRAVSHDLRTPLTSIYGACSTVIENYDSLDKEQKVKLLGEACSDAQWLNRMVENLLSVTRFDNDKVAVQKTPTVLEELIDTVLVRFQKRYPDVNVKLELPDSFIVIPMDSMLISQVLTNLLENAVLHAEGMTQLTLKVFTVGSHAVFEVTDNGCGIPKERLKKLFSGMLPAEDTADHGKHSMGIGLSVCAAIVKAHGGEIKAESRQGEGTTIRFWLETESIETEENQDEQ